MDNGNYFDHDEEDVLHDAFLMIVSSDTEYDCIEDVLKNETIYDQQTIDFWRYRLSE